MNKNKYKNMMFFAPDEGGGEGGGGGDRGAAEGAAAGAGGGEMTRGEAVFDPIPKTTTGDRPLPGKKTEAKPVSSSPEGAETTEAAPVKPSGEFDASKFAKEFGDTLSSTLKPILERTQPEKEMSQEEARKLLNYWDPDENWYKSFDNLETRNEAIGQMRDALVKQADTLAQFRMREMIDALREEIMPGLKTVSETANAQREERFNTQFPQLAKPELKPLIKSIAQDFVDNKKTFKSEGELFKALANGVEAVFKVSNPDFKLETTNNGGDQQSADRGGRQLPVTTPGGGGGTGRRESTTKTDKPRGLAIFDR